MTDNFACKMTDGLSEIDLTLTDDQLEKFFQYYEMIVKWNQFMNLTAITEMNEVILKHFVDSLALVRAERRICDQELSLIDVGTGAGFPGIPLKIAFPQSEVMLLDSLNKRVNFLDEVFHVLSLKGISAMHGRAEDLGHKKDLREHYDISVSRAVANFSTLAEYCLPFVKVGGYFISYKSGKIEEELNEGKHAVFLLGGKVEDVNSFTLPGTDMERTLIKVKKNFVLSLKYPRKAGLPSKEPLK